LQRVEIERNAIPPILACNVFKSPLPCQTILNYRKTVSKEGRKSINGKFFPHDIFFMYASTLKIILRV